MRMEAGAGLSCMQNRSKSRGAILQKMRHRNRSVSTTVGKKIY
jgi:hypothetical protein